MNYTINKVDENGQSYSQIHLEPFWALVEEALNTDLTTLQYQQWLLEAIERVIASEEGTSEEFSGTVFNFGITKEETIVFEEEEGRHVMIPTKNLLSVLKAWNQETIKFQEEEDVVA